MPEAASPVESFTQVNKSIRIYELAKEQAPSSLESVEDHGPYFVVRLAGDVSMAALARGRSKMTAVIEELGLYTKSVLCDFGKTQYADTATLAALVERFATFRTQSEGKLKLIFFNIPEHLKNLLAIAKLSEVLLIRDTFAAARLALDS